jgi:hypothetical protein
MSSEDIAQAIEEIKPLAKGSPNLTESIKILGDIISAGSISNSAGVAIGRNIQMVVNQLSLPAETVAALLSVRSILASSLGLDADRYSLKTLLADKTHDFVGRTYVFDSIEEFLKSHDKGYLVVQADPGMGKSAILAEYVRRSGCIAHFNVRAAGIVTARQFLENICAQIIIDFGLPYPTLPPDATQEGIRLSKMLQEASSKLTDEERLVIAVDALDEVELMGHPSGANILYLPKVLPKHVYFILTKRHVSLPFVVEVPQFSLDLMRHQRDNRNDVEIYISRRSDQPAMRNWIARQKISKDAFVKKLADLSENNFMYLHYVLPEIESGTYQVLEIDSLPTGLQGYYEDHWRHMGMTTKPIPRAKIRMIYVMCEVREPVSRKMIVQFATDKVLQVDELTVQEVLDEWNQFLHKQPTADGLRYSIYHASFRDFLHRKEIVQAAGITIKEVNALIADTLWGSVFGEPTSERGYADASEI